MQQIITNKLGNISYEDKDVIIFNNGLLGFEEYKRYILIRNDKNKLFFFLQSIDESNLMFVLVSPKMVFSDYQLEIHESELIYMDIENLIDFCIVTIPDVCTDTTVNLLGPIIIDVKKQIGKQVVSLNSKHTTKHSLILGEKEEKIAI